MTGLTRAALRAVLLVVAALAICMAATPPSDAARTDGIMVGDSITFMGKPLLQELRPDWKINGDPGRPVTAAPDVIRHMLAKYGTPKRLIIALGQNNARAWRWTKADYRDLVRMVPETTHVFFVTTWKDANLKGEAKAAVQGKYSSWMRNIAASQPNVDVIEWRNACRDTVDPTTGNSTLLEDGSHPTDPDGRTTWANLISQTVSEKDPT